jgi:hypothetical protein
MNACRTRRILVHEKIQRHEPRRIVNLGVLGISAFKSRVSRTVGIPLTEARRLNYQVDVEQYCLQANVTETGGLDISGRGTILIDGHRIAWKRYVYASGQYLRERVAFSSWRQRTDESGIRFAIREALWRAFHLQHNLTEENGTSSQRVNRQDPNEDG